MDISLSDLAKTGKQFASFDARLERINVASTDVAVWQARLDLDDTEVALRASYLSADERMRADRFHSAEDRRRYIVARGTLRQLLAQRLNESPSGITFGYAANGKPYLDNHSETLHFNLSHSADRALYALSADCELGIDIENLDREIDHTALAQRFFTPNECTALQNIEASRRKRAFLACWTRKEAVIKSTGDGLAQPMNQFEVTVEPSSRPRLIATQLPRLAGLSLLSLDVGAEFVATLAISPARRSG